MKESPIWFPGALWNYAENLLRHDNDAIACTCARENGEVMHYTFKQLRNMVRELSAAMRVSGVHVGNRVAGQSPTYDPPYSHITNEIQRSSPILLMP